MKQCITNKLNEYLDILDGTPATGLHKLFIQEIEQTLIELVLKKEENNQTKTAKVLGLNRSTLRAKIKQYSIKYD
ncbi:DNA-binding protein Fis [hydrothermal vent metagenome]|uniref:Putative Fis-like DNA-binding protein n=1 Tax=hydrothermal vent metagenome TaxID=652676 RepID=A0A1W1BIL1_9ZZZZ